MEKDKEGNPFVAVACEDDGAKTWLPIKMYLGDEPDSISTHYTVPTNLMAISNGNLISVDENNNNTKTYHWKTSYSINPYNITFYIGNYKLIETDYNCIDGEKMSLKYYVLPQSYTKATTHFEQTKNILSVYESLFGKYPWPKDGFKLVESPYAGMEHQTAIAYGNGYKNEKRENYDYIILHETAHEWWGNAVSVSDFSDLWIHEGIATYAEALYVEKTKSYTDYINYTYWTALTVCNKKPVVGPKGVYYTNYKDGDVYNKGAIMLHTLRNHLDNDSLFFNILKTFFKDYCYKMANTDDFVKIANQLSKQNLTPFFNHYLYKRYSPMLRWNFDNDDSTGKSILIYKLTGVSSDVNLKIHFKQGDKEFSVIANSELQSVPLPYHGRISVEANTKNSYVQDGFGRVEPSN